MWDASQEAEFSRIYTEFTGEPTDYAAVCRDKKLLVMREILGSDVNRLTTLFGVVCERTAIVAILHNMTFAMPFVSSQPVSRSTERTSYRNETNSPVKTCDTSLKLARRDRKIDLT